MLYWYEARLWRLACKRLKCGSHAEKRMVKIEDNELVGTIYQTMRLGSTPNEYKSTTNADNHHQAVSICWPRDQNREVNRYWTLTDWLDE